MQKLQRAAAVLDVAAARAAAPGLDLRMSAGAQHPFILCLHLELVAS